MYRIHDSELEVFLVHPGGPFFRNRDEDSWTIPKGEPVPEEELLAAAKREFEEEVGIQPTAPFTELGTIKQKGGKVVHAWAFEGQWDENRELTSNTFELEWPPHSGRKQNFPEVDRGAFFRLAEARKKLKAAQHPFLDRLASEVERGHH